MSDGGEPSDAGRGARSSFWIVAALAGIALGGAVFAAGGVSHTIELARTTLGRSALDVRPAGADAAANATGGANSRQRDARGPIAVEVAAARSAKTSTDILAIGSLQSDESVQIAPEIAGRIAEIAFAEGKPVKTGAVIVKLDDALAAAEVADTQARLTLASANNDRARALAKTGNVTGRGRDEALANFETAQAALDLAKTRLAKHVLVAPFDGIAGVRSVSVGAFVNAGTAITNVEKIDVLKVDFKVPEIHLQDVKVDQALDVQVDALPGQTFSATIYAINPMLDVNGRALQVRARMDNKDSRLRPGLFARLTIKGLAEREVVLIPGAAVVPRGSEAFVFLIDEGKAVERKVKLGQRSNAEVEVLDGLDARARVVTAGQQKLRDGAAIDILPSSAAKTAPAPELPEDDSAQRARAAAAGRSG